MPSILGLAGPHLLLLRQGLALLDRLEDSQFSRSTPLNPGGSVGRHLRHCLDFYRCFLDGVESGTVDYTHREREEAVEKRPRVARHRMLAVVSRLELLRVGGHRTLLVRDEASHEPGKAPGWSRSSVNRELQFLLGHTRHHFALMAILVRSFGVDPGEEFGAINNDRGPQSPPQISFNR